MRKFLFGILLIALAACQSAAATEEPFVVADLFATPGKALATIELSPTPTSAPTLPNMLTGATDMAQLRAKGVQAYGAGPMAQPFIQIVGQDFQDQNGGHRVLLVAQRRGIVQRALPARIGPPRCICPGPMRRFAGLPRKLWLSHLSAASLSGWA